MITLPDLAAQWKAAPDLPVRVAAFGSSNTELWWHNLGRFSWFCWLATSFRAHVGKQVASINLGICGNTVDDLLARAPRDLWPLNPTAVLVTIGFNDHWRMTVPEYVARLRRLAQQILDRGGLPIFRTYYSMLMEDTPGLDEERFTPYMQAMADLAAEMDLPCIDYYTPMHAWHQRDRVGYRRIMLDGAHLNPLGHALVGVMTVRAFGLPDPPLPDDLSAPVAELLGEVASCSTELAVPLA